MSSYHDHWENFDSYPPGASNSRTMTRSQTGFIRTDITPEKLDLFADSRWHHPIGLPHVLTFMKGRNGSIPRTVVTRSLGKQLGETEQLEEGLQTYLQKIPIAERERTKTAKKGVKKDKAKAKEVKDEKEKQKVVKQEVRPELKEGKEVQKAVKAEPEEEKEKSEKKPWYSPFTSSSKSIKKEEDESEEDTDKSGKKSWYSSFTSSSKSIKKEDKDEDKKGGVEQEAEYDDGRDDKSVSYSKPYIRQ